MHPPPAVTGYPMDQPPPALPSLHVQPTERPWSTGLYDCDCEHDEYCLTCFCPCITFGRIAEIVDRGSISSCGSAVVYWLICMTGFVSVYSCFYRYRLRQQYGLREEPCADCCVHFWCECCALCQMYRELRREFDMTIGWHGNMDRRRSMVATAPPAHQEMHA